MTDADAPTIDRETREDLLEQVSRQSSTVGASIPDTVEIDGQDFPLREFVWETKRTGRVPTDRRSEVRTVRSKLTAERKRRYERLRTEALTREEAQTLAATIVGIDRALTSLSTLSETDLSEEQREAYVEDNRRWVAFIDQLTE